MAIRLSFAMSAALLVGAAPVSAAEPAWLNEAETSPEGVRSINIDLSDIDLTTAEGPEALRDRVRRAASVVCSGPLPDHVTYQGEARARAACRRDTVSAVEDQVSGVISRAKSGDRALAITLQGTSPLQVN